MYNLLVIIVLYNGLFLYQLLKEMFGTALSTAQQISQIHKQNKHIRSNVCYYAFIYSFISPFFIHGYNAGFKKEIQKVNRVKQTTSSLAKSKLGHNVFRQPEKLGKGTVVFLSIFNIYICSISFGVADSFSTGKLRVHACLSA